MATFFLEEKLQVAAGNSAAAKGRVRRYRSKLVDIMADARLSGGPGPGPLPRAASRSDLLTAGALPSGPAPAVRAPEAPRELERRLSDQDMRRKRRPPVTKSLSVSFSQPQPPPQKSLQPAQIQRVNIVGGLG